MFVIDSYIEVNEEDRMPYKVYGIYDSKELAIKALNKLNNYFQNNYSNNILYVWNFGDGFTIQFTYVEPDDIRRRLFMTVEELIKELEKYPKDLIVTVPSTYAEYNIDEMEATEVIIGELYKGVLIC